MFPISDKLFNDMYDKKYGALLTKQVMLCFRINLIEQLMSAVLLFSPSNDFRNKKKIQKANEG